jgi:hypothetical protein
LRATSAGLLLASGLLFSGTALPQEPPPAPPLRAAKGDVELLSRIVAESRVETRAQPQGATDYLAQAAERLVGWLVSLLRPLGRYTASMGPYLAVAARALALLAAALLLYLFVRLLTRKRRGGDAADESSLLEGASRSSVPLWDSAEWRRELLARLERADVQGSLEALWWWLARSVEGLRVDDSWTSRDLLARARRPGLTPPVRRLERMMYGSRRPSVEEVRELLRSLEQQLA